MSFSYEDDDAYEDSEDFLIEAYLYENSLYHNEMKTPWHSWPCCYWTDKPATMNWEAMRNHGLIPKNVHLLLDYEE